MDFAVCPTSDFRCSSISFAEANIEPALNDKPAVLYIPTLLWVCELNLLIWSLVEYPLSALHVIIRTLYLRSMDGMSL